MFKCEKLNNVFRSTLSHGECNSPYATLSDMAAHHHGRPKNQIIFEVIAMALDSLEEDRPPTIVELESAITDHAETYNTCLQKYCVEGAWAHVALKDQEQAFLKLRNDTGNRPVNFLDYNQNVKELTRLKAAKDIIEALSEIEVSNRVIKDIKSGVALFADQWLAFDEWKESRQYSKFINAYASIRKETIMADRKITRDEKFNP